MRSSMHSPKRILILLHKHDPYPEKQFHLLFSLAEAWRAQGHDIRIQKGIEQTPEADIVIPHVDMTVIPDAYVDFLEQYPCVLNRTVRDISKRHISAHLLSPDDPYDGQVIVKTNLNCGGLPERRLENTAIAQAPTRLHQFTQKALRKVRKQVKTLQGNQSTISDYNYPIYDSLEEVPPDVFSNKAYVVEKFLPEQEGDRYYMRIYLFLGDRSLSVRLESAEPVIKGGNVLGGEEIPVPEELLAIRKQMGFDYGKFDYVIPNGKLVLIDANRTPGSPGHNASDNVNHLAPGLNHWLS